MALPIDEDEQKDEKKPSQEEKEQQEKDIKQLQDKIYVLNLEHTRAQEERQ